MHSSSLIVAGFLAVIGVALTSRKNNAAKGVGMVLAGLSALMLIAGVTA